MAFYGGKLCTFFAQLCSNLKYILFSNCFHLEKLVKLNHPSFHWTSLSCVTLGHPFPSGTEQQWDAWLSVTLRGACHAAVMLSVSYCKLYEDAHTHTYTHSLSRWCRVTPCLCSLCSVKGKSHSPDLHAHALQGCSLLKISFSCMKDWEEVLKRMLDVLSEQFIYSKSED